MSASSLSRSSSETASHIVDGNVLYPLEMNLTGQNIRPLIVQLLELLHILHTRASTIHGNVGIDHLLYRPQASICSPSPSEAATIPSSTELNIGQIVLIAFDFSDGGLSPYSNHHLNPPPDSSTLTSPSPAMGLPASSRSIDSCTFLPVDYLPHTLIEPKIDYLFPEDDVTDDVELVNRDGQAHRRHDLESVVYVALWCALVVKHQELTLKKPGGFIERKQTKCDGLNLRRCACIGWDLEYKAFWDMGAFETIKGRAVRGLGGEPDCVKKLLTKDFGGSAHGPESGSDGQNAAFQEKTEMEERWVWLGRLFTPFVLGFEARKRYLEEVKQHGDNAKLESPHDLGSENTDGVKPGSVEVRDMDRDAWDNVPSPFDMRTLGGFVDFRTIRRALDDVEPE